MQTEGMLAGDPAAAVVAGDVRANDNTELTAVQTLFAREHNRIVSELPRSLPADLRFQIARRVVVAEQQYITYTQFLPAVGVSLRAYRGYDPRVNTELSIEFSTVGYRAHSMVNGEGHIAVRDACLQPARGGPSGAPRRRCGKVGDGLELTVTLGRPTRSFTPHVLPAIGLAPVLRGLTQEPGYRNDVQLDDWLRSVLFEYPGPGHRTRRCACSRAAAPAASRACRTWERLTYSASAITECRPTRSCAGPWGSRSATSFTALTGESTDRFRAGARSRSDQQPAQPGRHLAAQHLKRAARPGRRGARAVSESQRSTLAARLKAI